MYPSFSIPNICYLLLLVFCSFGCRNNPVEMVALFEDGKITQEQVPISSFIDESATTFIIVRHAEKSKEGNDPTLTAEGWERAYTLSNVLQEINLAAIYSTDFKRTTQTALPTLNKLPLTSLKIYNAKDLPGFVEMAKVTYPSKNILVVGHSNSSPTLVNQLIGDDRFAQIPETDYDNLFVVNLSESGEAKAIHLKFGEGG